MKLPYCFVSASVVEIRGATHWGDTILFLTSWPPAENLVSGWVCVCLCVRVCVRERECVDWVRKTTKTEERRERAQISLFQVSHRNSTGISKGYYLTWKMIGLSHRNEGNASWQSEVGNVLFSLEWQRGGVSWPPSWYDTVIVSTRTPGRGLRDSGEQWEDAVAFSIPVCQ